MDINFYVKSMGIFIILSVVWYERLTKCYLLHTDPSEFRDLGKIAKQHAFLYQLWTARTLLKYFLALQTATPKFPPIRLMSQKWDVMPWAQTMGLDEIISPWGLDHGFQHHFCEYGLF